MEWKGRRQSSNVEDQSGNGPVRGGFGRGGGFRIPMGSGGRGGGLSIGTIIFLVVIYFIFKAMGIDLLQVLDGGQTGPSGQSGYEQSQGSTQGTAQQEETKAFIKTVLAETEDTWNGIFQASGRTYKEPTLVFFTGGVQSACGQASSASGPFYCPGDQKVYLDTAFFDELSQRFQASGDFAQAYVVAHEVGHHVQNLLGTLPKVNEQRQGMDEASSNELSVRTELQADCYAGIWGKYTQQKGLLEQGDLEEALNAATQIGDDTLQKRTQGYVVPESFNHGTSKQRATWFKRGFDSGQLQACDTFNSPV